MMPIGRLFRPVIATLVAVACAAAACGGQTDVRRSSSSGGAPADAGTGAPIEIGSGGAGATGGKASGGSVVHDASLNDDRAAVGTPGSGGSPSDSSAPDVTFFEGDAGPAPLPYCVPRCVWEVVKHCIPTMRECVTEPHNAGLGTKTCDPSTGWAETSGETSGRRFINSISRYGVECMNWSLFLEQQLWALFDARGTLVATMASGPDAGMECAGIAGDAGLDEGGVLGPIPHDPSRPECTAWDQFGFPARHECAITLDGGTCP